MEEIKPCPFCGSKAELEEATPTFDRQYGSRQWWGVVCRGTSNRGGSCAIQQRPSASKEAAIDRWNMRTPEPEQLKLDADEMVRQRLDAMTDMLPLPDLSDSYAEAIRDARKWLKENKDAD